MNYNNADYSFGGLSDNGQRLMPVMSTLAYLVGLVEGPRNEIAHLDKALFTIRLLFDMEEQVESASELLTLSKDHLPKSYYPQTPVMLTLEWSPISSLLEKGWKPAALGREAKRWSCASGIWEPQEVPTANRCEECKTPEELFWHVMQAVVEKARSRRLMISIIAKPGWSYKSNVDRPDNITLAEAKQADRVIWQRTPRPE